MSETQPVRITGGTTFIGLLVFITMIQACRMADYVKEIRDRLPKPAVEVVK